MDHPEIQENEKSVWEKPGTLRLIWIGLIAACVGFAAAGFWLASKGKLVYKPHFEDKTGIAGTLGSLADNFPAFYALVGFVSFSFIVLAGQHLRHILMRKEDYYDAADEQSPKVTVEDGS